MARKLLPVHPGEILLEEFLKPMGITQYRLAKDGMTDVLARIRPWKVRQSPQTIDV